MSTTNTAGIFESFNARALNPAQVAATFVPSNRFEQLCKRCHTVALGPRGSGKTTLLKMLQQLALESWRHPDADFYVKRIDFTGVFVATDISWGEQLASLGHGRLDEQTHKIFSVASFTTHVLRSLVSALQSRRMPQSRSAVRAFRHVILDTEAEARLVADICRAWHVTNILPTLLALRQALTQRLSLIRELASREVTFGDVGRADRLGNIEFLHLHFLQSASVAIELFEASVNESDGKWALLFDELELAPQWIQDELVRSLRSTDERFLFKLALNPFTSNIYLLQTAVSAAPGQDFEQIPLWYAEKRESYSFCHRLWREMLKERGIHEVPARKILGTSYFDAPSEDIGAYPCRHIEPHSGADGPCREECLLGLVRSHG